MNLTNDFQKNTNFLNEEFQKLKMVYGANQIPTEILVKLNYKDIATLMFQFVQKFVIYDDVLTFENGQVVYNMRM